MTCTEVDADGQPVRDKQLTISVNNYLLTKNITVINNNSDNKDKATTYLRFYYAGNDNYDADEQIITLNFAKEVQKVTYTYNKRTYISSKKKYNSNVETANITVQQSVT